MNWKISSSQVNIHAPPLYILSKDAIAGDDRLVDRHAQARTVGHGDQPSSISIGSSHNWLSNDDDATLYSR